MSGFNSILSLSYSLSTIQKGYQRQNHKRNSSNPQNVLILWLLTPNIIFLMAEWLSFGFDCFVLLV